MRVKKNTNKNRPLWLQFSVKRRTRECSFDEKKNIIVLKTYMYFAAAGFEKKNTCQVFSKWNAHCTYLLRFEVQKVKLLNSLFNKLCIYVCTYFILNIYLYNPSSLEDFVQNLANFCQILTCLFSFLKTLRQYSIFSKAKKISCSIQKLHTEYILCTGYCSTIFMSSTYVNVIGSRILNTVLTKYVKIQLNFFSNCKILY